MNQRPTELAYVCHAKLWRTTEGCARGESKPLTKNHFTSIREAKAAGFADENILVPPSHVEPETH